jgi:hypothetical protein
VVVGRPLDELELPNELRTMPHWVLPVLSLCVVRLFVRHNQTEYAATNRAPFARLSNTLEPYCATACPLLTTSLAHAAERRILGEHHSVLASSCP